MKLYKHVQTGHQLYRMVSDEPPYPKWQKMRHSYGKFYPEDKPFPMCPDGFVECREPDEPHIDYKASFEKQLYINRMLRMTNVIFFITIFVVGYLRGCP